MAYETPITIKEAIVNIKKDNYLLPSIQREFVWDTDQIERLFDSLMRDYPISTFLFWKVEKEKVKDFQFYKFLRHYHEVDSKHNVKAELEGDQGIIALLDGQQRMTSLFLGLCGTYAKKLPYFSWNNPNAFPKKKLYLNLLQKSENIEFEYDFRFLSEEEKNSIDSGYWFECSKILELDMSMGMNFLLQEGVLDTSRYTQEQTQFAVSTFSEFWNVVHQKGTICYYLEKSEELDKVLQIFIRVNSGGKVLSYSDLLLSIATAQWKEKDAREVIHSFVDYINRIGDGFDFNKDFVLKSCLVLSDLADIKFKVDNFTKENMSIIESKWDKTSKAVQIAVELVAKLGYSKDNLLASNAVIPIAYFIAANNYEDTILQSGAREDDRKLIKEWLARVFLKGTFGGTPDGIYPVMRRLVNDNLGRFPLAEVIAEYKLKRKSISFSEEDLESILNLKYGKARTFCALTLLYPGLNHNYKYHQDHIHPKSFFTKRKLNDLGITDSSLQKKFIDRFNLLPNLQILQANMNIEKNNQPFESWLESIHHSISDKEAYLLQNHIDVNQSLAFEDFVEFFDNRKAKLKIKLATLLDVKLNTTATV